MIHLSSRLTERAAGLRAQGLQDTVHHGHRNLRSGGRGGGFVLGEGRGADEGIPSTAGKPQIYPCGRYVLCDLAHSQDRTAPTLNPQEEGSLMGRPASGNGTNLHQSLR